MEINERLYFTHTDIIHNLQMSVEHSEGKYQGVLKKILQRDKKSSIGLIINDMNKDGETFKYIKANFEAIAKKHALKTKAKSYKDAEKALKEVDLRHILGVKVELKEVFTTDLFLTYGEKEHQELYVNYTKDGYRIFFKRKELSYKLSGQAESFEFSLNLIDLYQLTHDNEKYYEIMEALCNMFKIEAKKEIKFANAQKIKHADNLIALKNIEKYPNLSELISKNLIVLKQLNDKTLDCSLTIEKSYKGETVFYAPVRKIADELKDLVKQATEDGTEAKSLSTSTITRLLQLYRVLGLIEMVETENVPPILLTSAPKANELHVESVYYIVPQYNSAFLEKAEKIAKKLNKGGFKIAEIKYETIKKILGEKIADKAYAHVADRMETEKKINEHNIELEKQGEEKKLYGKTKRAKTIEEKKKAKAEGTEEVINSNNNNDDMPF